MVKERYYNSILVIIIILTGLIYSSVYKLEYVNWDDEINIVGNSKIHEISKENIVYNFTNERYKSLALFSYTIDYSLWGNNPAPYHIHNLFLHILNIVLIFITVNLISRNKLISLFTAGLFALHPVSVEAVAWVTGRKDLLFLLFSLLSILAYKKYIDSKFKICWFFATTVLVYVASMSKIQAFVLPILFIVFDWYFSRKLTLQSVAEKLFILILLVDWYLLSLILLVTVLILKYNKSFRLYFNKNKYRIHGLLVLWLSLVLLATNLKIESLGIISILLIGLVSIIVFRRKISLFLFDKYKFLSKYYWNITIPLFAFSILLFFLQKTEGIGSLKFYFWQDQTYLFFERLLLGGDAILYYLKRLFLIIPFNPMYAYPEQELIWSLNNPYFIKFIIAIAILSSLCLVILKTFKKYPIITLGLLIFVINISIVMHIIPIEGRVVAADRYAYPSFWGLFLITGYLFSLINFKFRTKVIFVLIIPFILISWNIYSNISIWKNSYTFWTEAVKQDKYNSYAHNALGCAYLDLKNQVDSALYHFNKAIELNPRVSEYHVDKGRALYTKDPKSITSDYYTSIIKMDSTNDMAFNNRAALYIKEGKYNNAINDYKKAISISETNDFYVNNLKKAQNLFVLDSLLFNNYLTEEYTIDEKLKFIKISSADRSDDGNLKKALDYLLIGFKIDSTDTYILNNLATMYSTLGEYENSIKYYILLTDIEPENSQLYFYLANNYYNNNQLDMACKYWLIALEKGYRAAQDYINMYCD
jgi:tetratricopeptide (TPR) repeat protein